MTDNNSRRCSGLACKKRMPRWRQCPEKSCGLEIAYCDEHGGDEMARKKMEAHILQEHNPSRPPRQRIRIEESDNSYHNEGSHLDDED